MRIDTIGDKIDCIKHTDFRSNKSLFYKVLLKDGRYYRDYKYERSRALFEAEGVKLYGYTKNLFPITILLDWKH